MHKSIGALDEKIFDFLIIILTLLIFLPIIFINKPVRVGDGSEYYALSLAWKNTNRPFMTESSWVDYQKLFESKQITGLVKVETVKANFVKDVFTGVPSDSHHFWFYSFCAAALAGLFNIVNINISIHVSFLLVHFAFLSILFVISWRYYKWKGVLTIVLLTFLSPIAWYIDKVHTEFFTYCVTTSALILFSRKNYSAAAFFLALASTQNISFAGISIILVLFDIYSRKNKSYSRYEGIVVIITIVFCVLHPLYYFPRYGFVDPKVSGLGGEIILGNIQYFYVWFFDPDIGLFPNWPFGVVILLLAIIAMKNKLQPMTAINRWVVFYIGYILISVLAQSSTQNLNSGGTPGLARYALWYIALFFPILILLIDKAVISAIWRAGLIITIVFGLYYSNIFFNPGKPENYTKPSIVSNWIQKNMPNLYYPPPEIFAERFGGMGESSGLWQALAIAGPDCRKLLIINPTRMDNKTVLTMKKCQFNNGKLSAIIRGHLSDGSWTTSKKYPIGLQFSPKINSVPFFISLSLNDLKESITGSKSGK